MNKLEVSKSIKKKFWRFILNLLLVTVAIPPSLTLLFVSPMVQTISAKLATHLLSKKLNHKIEIERIQLSLIRGITINGLKVNDNHGNILIGVKKLTTMPVFADILNNKLIFSNVSLDGAAFEMGKYKNDSTLNLNRFIASLSDSSQNDTISSSTSAGFKLLIINLNLTNSHFRLFDEDYMREPSATMDYANIVVDSINLSINQFSIVDDSLHFKINSLNAKEQCGLKVDDFSSDFFISSKGLISNETMIRLGESSINADFGLHTENWGTYSEYLDSVFMTGTFRPSTVNMADIGYFADIMYQMPNVVGITGQVEGTVTHLKGRHLRIKYGKSTRVSGNISMKGLPDFYTTEMHGDSLDIHLSTGDLKTFHLPIEEQFVDFTSYYPANDPLVVSGTFDGYYEDFSTNLRLATTQGSFATKVSFVYKETDTIGFTLSAQGEQVNVGNLLNLQDVLGLATFNVNATGSGKDFDRLRLQSQGELTSTRLLDYNYKGIKYNLRYQEDSAYVEVKVDDPNLVLEANADINSIAKTDVSLVAHIENANLKSLGFVDSPPLIVSSDITSQSQGMDLDSLMADISLKNTLIIHQKDEYTIDSMELHKAQFIDGKTELSLLSEIADFTASGQFKLTTIGSSLSQFINHYYDFSGTSDSVTFHQDENIEVTALIKKPEIFENLIFTGISFSPQTALNGKIDLNSKDVDLTGFSSKINIQGIRLDSNLVIVSNKNKKLAVDYSALHVILKDSTTDDKSVFGIDDLSLSAKLAKDSIIYGVYWNNQDTLPKNTGIIEGYIATYNDTTYINIGKSDVVINDSLWRIDTSNLVVMADSRVRFENFNIMSGTSELQLSGTIPKVESDSLVAKFVHWNLSNFDLLTRNFRVDLNGFIDGDFQLTMIKNNPTLVSNLTITDFWFNNEYLGKARLLNTWDNTTNAIFIKSQIIREGNSGVGEVFSADGYYYPFKKEDNLSINIGFNRIKLKSFEPFLSDFIRQIEGTTSGALYISGSLNKPVIKGSAKLQRTSLIVNYLNTRYSFSNSIDFEENALNFNNLVLYDTLGNKAEISGKLEHNHFKDSQFDVVVSTDKLLFFNTTMRMNELYYGTAIASGNIYLTGSPNNIHLKIRTRTKKGTFVYLPLSYTVEISDKDYIVFVKSSDSIAETDAINKMNKEQDMKSKFDIGINMSINPEAGVSISLPSDMGNIEARGNGDLIMNVNSEGEFNLYGDYVVDNGTFQFNLGNVVSKRFTLVNGGRISWTGSPYTANVNIQGLYKVKTNLKSLGIQIDSTAGYKNNVTVNCYIMLTHELLNPVIRFRITTPNLDPELQRMVFAALDTSNVAMMNQQMISLLVLGTFSFNNASNISLSNSYYGILSNQLSNMLSQISDAFDVGVNYKPGDAVTQEEFEVALSTQLFDDRLTIDGNFGMTYDKSQQSASNLVGDINIGYKLTQDGRWVLKVFNHSNVNPWYNSSAYDQISPYTQGVGIAFRKEFNNIAELFANSRKRERLKQKEARENKAAENPVP
ncbi:MAG: translocation/assembly module TamB domain-containing protein [Bacteroidales bacterium]